MHSLVRKTLMIGAGGLSLLAGTMPAMAGTYTTSDGATLWTVSQRFGVPLSRVVQLNPAINPQNVPAGQVIQLPSGVGTKVYTIQSNNTFWSIAMKQKTTVSTLLSLNPNADPQKLIPGQTIQIPATSIATPAPTVLPNVSLAPQATGQTITTTSGQVHVLNEVATAYTANDNGPYGAVDSLGNPLKPGTIAVDPRYIPLGSTVYVTGYNYAGLPSGGFVGHATDVGGAIVGNRIDIYVPQTDQQALNFGMQNVKVYVISK